MKKNFIRLTCLVMVAVIGIGAAFATDGKTNGGWNLEDALQNAGDTTLQVNWNVDLERDTYEVGYMDNGNPLAPNVVSQLELTDDQQGEVFKGIGNVNVYWNVFSRKAFTLKLGVAEPLKTLEKDESKTQADENADKINWQVTFQPKEVNSSGVIVDKGGKREITIGSVATNDYATGYGEPTVLFEQKANIVTGDKRKSDFTGLKIETQDIGDGSKIAGNYAGTLTLTVESK